MTLSSRNLRDTTMETTNWLLAGIIVLLFAILIVLLVELS